MGRQRSSLLFPPRATRSVRKNQMKRGSEATVTIVGPKGDQIELPISLSGFELEYCVLNWRRP